MEIALLAFAGFVAGGLNAVAGGGTFLTFPALVLAGMPPISANATSAVGVLPGYLSSAAGFRRDIEPVHGVQVWTLVAIGLLGGLAGALLLLITPADVFQAVVPWMLLIATLLFAAGPWLSAGLRDRASSKPTGKPTVIVSLLVVSAYGGYFNGGLGILLLALFSLLGLNNLNAMNGLKNVISAVLSIIAAAAFAAAGVVAWPEALVMMATSTCGGYVGAALARNLPQSGVRLGIVAIGLTMSALFFYR